MLDGICVSARLHEAGTHRSDSFWLDAGMSAVGLSGLQAGEDVNGVDDAMVDGSVSYTIILNPATSSDAHYHGRDAANVGVVNTDNDSAAGIPTLSEWALGLLAMLLTVMGVQSVRQRRSER